MRQPLKRVMRLLGRKLGPLTEATLGRLAVAVLRGVRRTDPHRMSDRLGAFMRRIGPWLPEHRIGYTNLIAAFPEKSSREIDEILLGVWENLGRLAAEFAHLDRIWDHDPEDRDKGHIEFTDETLARFIQLRDDGKPALVFAAHLANWEVPALPGPAHGLPSAVIYRAPNMKRAAKAIMDIRALSMGELIRTGLDTPVKAADALERGLHVGMLVDQYYVRGVPVTFFGRKTNVNPLIARLARQIDAPIHGTRAVRLPGHRFRADLTEEIPAVRDAEGRVDVEGTMQAITNVVEGWIREHPEQWLWLHRRWR